MLSIIIIRIAITISNCIRAVIGRRDLTKYCLQFYNYTSLRFRIRLYSLNFFSSLLRASEHTNWNGFNQFDCIWASTQVKMHSIDLTAYEWAHKLICTQSIWLHTSEHTNWNTFNRLDCMRASTQVEIHSIDLSAYERAHKLEYIQSIWLHSSWCTSWNAVNRFDSMRAGAHAGM